ncbi:tRNA pseudouridine(38-40) synthase TruA [Tissierella praeacuta]|uniref:tRNA pseudouridine(38-40) synthase TruA n=1 Tax=Tissierella praeacuta TaxID=43131 RepID=UPI001C128ACC|nr:tRNA pseudouridine(38-40) synthase TruA [Tissierella praeacuta]MBU5256316.1 tRNA pseudouridine(38-40) synthase TruA [Tissierella praeacuta]
MKNIKLVIEYEGTNYSGWQKQENAITIQEKLEDAIEKLSGEKIKLIGSGRTDGKVHALGQVANFLTTSSIPGKKYKYALKFLLPDDITIVESEEVDLKFHSRFDAIKKRYKYIVYNGELPRAIYRNFSYHVPYNIDINKMIEASQHLIGTHDFSSFMAANSEVNSTVRTIYDISIKKNKKLIEFNIEGNSFLRNMVRIIVGTLLYIGFGKINGDNLPKIILDKKRKGAGPTAPPQGLFLEKVYYS